MDVNVSMEEALRQKERKRTIIKRIVWISAVVLAILLIVLYTYYFGEYTLFYEDMYDGIKPVMRDGFITFDMYMTDSGLIGYRGGGASKTVLNDYEKGSSYRYYAISVYAQRWHLEHNKGVLHNLYLKLFPDGRDYANGDLTRYWFFDKDIDYEKSPEEMVSKYLRVYYMDPDGTLHLVWQHPDFYEIMARTGAELEAPLNYFILGSSQ